MFKSSSSSISDETLKNLGDKINFFRKKALSTRKMRDSFKFLDSIVAIWQAGGGVKNISKVSWRRGNAKAWEQIVSSVFKWVLMMVFHKQEYKEIGTKNWCEVFYGYLQCEDALRYNILEANQVQIYYDLLTVVQGHLTPEIHDSAEELCSYFDYHRVDPYSAVIGLPPCKEILRFSMNISDAILETSLKYDLLGQEVKKTDFKNRYADLISSLVYWSTLTDEETLKEIRRAAATIRGVQNLEKGSLVLVRVQDNPRSCFFDENQEIENWIFARVAGHMDKQSIVLLYVDPTESKVISTSLDKTIPVAPEMIQKFLADGIPSELGKAVTHLSSVLTAYITTYCSQKMKEYFEEFSSPKLLELVMKNHVRIEHQTQVRLLNEYLNEPIDSTTLEECHLFSNQIKKRYAENIDSAPKWCSFVTALKQDKDAVSQFDVVQSLDTEIIDYKQSCQLAIANINRQKERIFGGQRKQEMVDLWFRRISDGIQEFLTQHGYEFDIIPSNYLDQPPKSITGVRRNLVLLRRMLKSYYSSHRDAFHLKKMVKEIQDLSYASVDNFISDVYHCVAEVLDMEVCECSEKSLHELNIAIQQKNLDDTVRMKTVSILKDRFHLQDMKRMETDSDFAVKNRMKTVPISGLVLSKLARLENECKSVLDLWEPVRIPKTAEDARTPLESAVIKGDTKQLESLLKGNLSYINEQDVNGWTALHLSCSYYFNQHRLPVTEFIINTFEEVDATIPNNGGNTCIHYLARMPITENTQQKYRDVLHLILLKGNAIYMENHKGETPLHLAALAANAHSTRFLLECGSDPNAQNKDGNTPLHYAIQSTNMECVALLMSYSGNYRITNNNQEDGLDISIKLNLTDISNLFHQQEWTEVLEKDAVAKKEKGEEFKKSKGICRPWDSLTKLPTVPIPSCLINQKPVLESPQEPPRKRPKISDPVNNTDWKKPPIPDAVRNAMLKILQEKEENPKEENSSPPDAQPGSDLASQIGYEAKSEALRRNPLLQQVEQAQEILKGRKFCRVLWDIEPDDADELELRKGDLLEVLEEDESGWWTGSCHGNIGSFPVNYTKIIEDISSNSSEIMDEEVEELTGNTDLVVLDDDGDGDAIEGTKGEISLTPDMSIPLEERFMKRANSIASSRPSSVVPKGLCLSKKLQRPPQVKLQAKRTILSPRQTPASPPSPGTYKQTKSLSVPEVKKEVIDEPKTLDNQKEVKSPTVTRVSATPVPATDKVTPTPVGEKEITTKDISIETTPVAAKPSPMRLRDQPRPQSEMLPARSLPIPKGPGRRVVKKAVVVETFTAESDEEISLKLGAVVTIIKKDEDGWWTVVTHDGLKGVFPGSHLKEQLPRAGGRGRPRGRGKG